MLYSIDTIYNTATSLLPLESLAKTSGFVLSRPRKLSLEALLQSIPLASPHRRFPTSRLVRTLLLLLSIRLSLR
jgi:hypothetical protein